MPRVLHVGLAVLLTGAAAYVIVQNANRRKQGEVADCRARYAAARTRSDTLAVDARLLPNPGSRVELWRTCGRYRRAGDL